MFSWRWIHLATLLLSLAAPARVLAGEDEYGVKAAFLFNFAKFVEWPNDAFASPTAGIVLCVASGGRADVAVQEIVKGKVVNGRPIEVRQVSDDQIASCHLLFVPDGSDRAARLLDDAKASSVLTVGESPGFTQIGGVINFMKQENKVRFEINEEAAKRARLKISSKLLSLAKSTGS